MLIGADYGVVVLRRHELRSADSMRNSMHWPRD